jgi:formate dehydrogenase subunit delta
MSLKFLPGLTDWQPEFLSMSNSNADEKLVRMANQIATFFLSQPEATRIDGIATHINKFWEPRMRRRFLEIVEGGEVTLHSLAVEAASRVKRPA